MSIDVQGSLFPNPLTMVIQLLATLVIFLAVKKWLWKPVKKIIAARADKMQESLDSAFLQNQEANENLKASKKELEEAKNTSKEIIDAARVEAVNIKNELINQAKRDAQAKLDKAEEKINEAKLQAKNDLHDEMVEVAMAAVSKLLDEKSTSDDDNKAIDKYISEAKK